MGLLENGFIYLFISLLCYATVSTLVLEKGQAVQNSVDPIPSIDHRLLLLLLIHISYKSFQLSDYLLLLIHISCKSSFQLSDLLTHQGKEFESGGGNAAESAQMVESND